MWEGSGGLEMWALGVPICLRLEVLAEHRLGKNLGEENASPDIDASAERCDGACLTRRGVGVKV